MTNFNHFCNQTERALSTAAVIPIIGTVAAICKFALGTIQTITALALGILSIPFRFCSDDMGTVDEMSFNDHCWSHVAHGLGNIIASIPEAIPPAGTCLYINRVVGHDDDREDNTRYFNPEQQDKYIPYSDVVIRNLAFGGLARRDPYNTAVPSALSPTRFRAFIGINVVSRPVIVNN